MRFASATRPFPGERHCGDVVGCWREGAEVWACIADGLGHGPDAARAAHALLCVVEAAGGDNPVERLIAADRAIRDTRGAAAAVARIRAAEGLLSVVGIGNIHGMVTGGRAPRFEGAPGIVGARCRNAKALVFPFLPGDLLIVWTDGLDEVEWTGEFDRLRDDLPRLAAALLDRFGRDGDDCGVLVVAGGDPT
jgi:hypothetical protein